MLLINLCAWWLFLASNGCAYQTRNLADIPCGLQRSINRSGREINKSNNTNQVRQSRIIGGENAARGEFPWLVSIKRRGGHFCGGSLINRRWVLTAAHCLCSGTSTIEATQLQVGVGEYDLRNADPHQPAVLVHVQNVHLHPEYKCPRFDNDIALLELTDEVEWTTIVGPACLPVNIEALGDSEATTVGWGWMDEHYGKRADILQKVKLTVVDNKKCQAWYRSEGKKVKILATQMCAGNESGGKDACWADSGGPLMVDNGSVKTVVGIVSTGIGCGRPHLPGLYTRLTDFMPWLLDMVEKI